MSLLPFHQNYLTSQFSYIQGISIFVCLWAGHQRELLLLQKNNNSHNNSIQGIVSIFTNGEVEAKRITPHLKRKRKAQNPCLALRRLSLLYTVWLLVSRSVNCNLSSLLFWASVHISPLLDISFSALFLGDVSFCFTLAAATPAWAPLTSFTGSANIDPLPSGSSQSVVQAIKSAFWPLPYPCPIYQPDNINKPPCWYNLRHIHWVPTLCQVLFWVLKKKNYKFTDLTVYNAFYLSHRGFRKDITSQLNWP